MIRVTVVSPNPSMRIGLRELLGRQTDIKVVSEVVDLDSVNETETEVVVLASVSVVRLPENVSYAVLFLVDEIDLLRGVVNLSNVAWGALFTDASEDELAAAVRAVGEGLWVGAPSLMRGLIRLNGRRELSDEDSLIEALTAREQEVLQLMAQGLANKQIALSLGISDHTVKFHLSSLYSKLGSSSRTEAVKRGIELGLISL
ncbi:MAG: response regulator transcription factor [Anaerolineales bacterium]|nr:response regulator transcription factor [Anaerolineales bacterium]MBP6210514.1 response regulator transcription factor [Anaerolineales bacterium]MBP8164303.1 response regulator transcription factor [Anaerolineales bacterium]